MRSTNDLDAGFDPGAVAARQCDRRRCMILLGPGYRRAMTTLHRVSADALEIERRPHGRGFTYTTGTGDRVSDPESRQRIRDLVIPPAWQEVRIAADPRGHIQACGVDDAGRRQYIYHPDWVQQPAEEKFDRVRSLADRLPGLRSQVREGLSGRGATQQRVTSAALRLLDLGAFRIGNDIYMQDNGSHGLSTLLRSHVALSGDGLRFRYPAKSGVERTQLVRAPEVVSIVRAMRHAPCAVRRPEDDFWSTGTETAGMTCTPRPSTS